MSLPNVNTPVIINASTTLLIQSDYYLRRCCIVSLGDTNLSKGEYVITDRVSYTDLEPKGETASKLTMFFNYASNKQVGVLELGVHPKTPLADNYTNLEDYITTLNSDYRNSYLASVYAVWEVNQETKEILISFLDTRTEWNQEAYTTWLTENSKEDELASLEEYVLTLNIPDYPNVYYQWLDGNEQSFKDLDTLQNLKDYAVTNIMGYSEQGYLDYLQEEGISNPDFSGEIEGILKWINEGNTKNYIYVLPKALYSYPQTAVMCGRFNDASSAQYFIIEVNKELTHWNNYKGLKSVIGIYSNGESDDYNLAGAFAGRFSSSIFDISANQKASPINYKAINGFNYTDLGIKEQNDLTQAGITFCGGMVGNTVLMNGRCADLRSFDYWYQWDLTSYNVTLGITSLLLNGVNNPNYVIQYNQNGIDTIAATITSELNKMIAQGNLTEFGASYNPATNELINIGYLYTIDYYSYISAYPDDYQNEVYGGISFYARVGKYIRQVIVNVTLG